VISGTLFSLGFVMPNNEKGVLGTTGMLELLGLRDCLMVYGCQEKYFLPDQACFPSLPISELSKIETSSETINAKEFSRAMVTQPPSHRRPQDSTCHPSALPIPILQNEQICIRRKHNFTSMVNLVLAGIHQCCPNESC
jgi:hypothetical protein